MSASTTFRNLVFNLPHLGQQTANFGRRRISTSGLQPIKMSYNVYEKYGSSNKPPVIIMHGVLGSKNNWNSLGKALNGSTKRKVIAVDARDHGDSPHTEHITYDLMAADVIHLLDSQSVERACLIGHSMGGRAMMKTAWTYPDRVEKLIVVDITPTKLKRDLHLLKYFGVLNNISLDDNLSLSEGRRTADNLICKQIPDVDIRQFLLSNLIKANNKFTWKANLQRIEHDFDNIITFPLANEVFNKPVFFIGGNKSEYLKEEDHDEIVKYFPLAKFQYLNAGHWVHAEQPHAFLKIATEFISSAS